MRDNYIKFMCKGVSQILEFETLNPVPQIDILGQVVYTFSGVPITSRSLIEMLSDFKQVENIEMIYNGKKYNLEKAQLVYWQPLNPTIFELRVGDIHPI